MHLHTTNIEAKLKPLEPYHNVGIFSFPFSFQFFTRLDAVFAEEVSINVNPTIWCRLIRCGDGRTAVRHLA